MTKRILTLIIAIITTTFIMAHEESPGKSYTYNLRGWITDITARNFEEHLTYNAGSYGTPYYNGNISTQQWRTSDDNILRGYKFTYDKLNRMVNSAYGEGTSFSVNKDRYTETIPEYTANGAMRKLVHNGLMQNGTYGAIDNLDITLAGNQLLRVDDNAAPVLRTGASDFYDDKIKTDGAEYEYDVNGALTMDANRGITKIEYDLRDNPLLIQFSDGSQTEYIYTSAGEKLRTIHRTASPNTSVSLGETIRLDNPISSDSTDYIGSFIFENGKPDKYLFGGGYYTYATPKTGYSNYHYFLTDHLGNNRVIVNGNDSIEQIIHYYPFGSAYADEGLNPDLQKYKYNGKELDLMHGLNTYDYGARQYYAVVPTWDRMDPMSGKYHNVSPYAYCHNNPIKFIDPTGLDVFDMNGKFIKETENDNHVYTMDENNKLNLLSSFNYGPDNENNINMLKNVASYYLSKNDSKKININVEETGNGIPDGAAFAYSINEDSYYVELTKSRINQILDDKYNFMSIAYHESRHRHVPETRGGSIGEVEAILMQSGQESWDLATKEFLRTQASYAQKSLQNALPLPNHQIDNYINRLNKAFIGIANFSYQNGNIEFSLTLEDIIVKPKK